MSHQSIPPATGETLHTLKEATDRELEVASQTVASCFENWRRPVAALNRIEMAPV